MVFNKLTIQQIANEVYAELKEETKSISQLTIKKDGDATTLLLSDGEETYSVSFDYDFYNQFARIWERGFWGASDEIIGLFQTYVQKIVGKLQEQNIDCWLSSSAYGYFPEELKKQVREVIGKDIIPIGEQATRLLHLVDELDIPYFERSNYLCVDYDLYDEGELSIKWALGEGKMKLIYREGDSYDEHPDYAYVMYEIDSKESYNAFLDDVKNHEAQKNKLQSELNAFVKEQEPAIKIVENNYYVNREGELIDYEYGIYKNQLCYRVSGFYGSFTTEHYDEILPFLKNDFHLYQEIKKARKEIVTHVLEEDDYAFFLEKCPDEEHYMTYYCSVQDRKIQIYLGYEKGMYHIHLKELSLESSYQKETILDEKYRTVPEAMEAFKEFYRDRTKNKRMELLFDPNYKKHYRKIFYMLGINDWKNTFVHTNLSLEKINAELETYFSTHELLSIRHTSPDNKRFGNLKVRQTSGILFIEESEVV